VTGAKRAATLLERAGAHAYMAGWSLARHLPERAVRGTFDRVAVVLWSRRGRGVVQLERNLRRVVGPGPGEAQLRELSRAAMRSYLRYWAETFRLPVWSSERIRSRIQVEGDEALRKHIATGVGVVLALPHSANWDLAGAWLVDSGVPFTTVAERLRPERLFDAFVAYREGLGMEVLALEPGSSGGAEVFATLAGRLREGRVVCLVADRDLTEAGVDVEFFGETARMPAGPAALSVSTGAALLPTTLWYDGARMHLRVHPEVDQPTSGTRPERVTAMTQRLATVFEGAIREHPADWHMLQRLWVDDLRLRHAAVPTRPPGS
jgi:lauroyl/myristoyl acyltransferase